MTTRKANGAHQAFNAGVVLSGREAQVLRHGCSPPLAGTGGHVRCRTDNGRRTGERSSPDPGDFPPGEARLADGCRQWRRVEAAVQALIWPGSAGICALRTEVCMALTDLDALREGYEAYPVVDAIGGTSPEARRAGLDRVIQAGGQPISRVPLACELQRDWARQETVPAVVEIVLTDRLLKEH
jgi:Isochorismatase family